MNSKKMKIKDIAQVIVTHPYKREEYSNSGVAVLGIPEIKESIGASRYISEAQLRNENLFLRKGDVLITRAETKYFIYHFVTDSNLPATIGFGLIILRPAVGMDQEFKSAFCSDQKMIELSKLVKGLYKGRVLKQLDLKAFGELEVSVEPVKKSQNINAYKVDEFVIQDVKNNGISYNEIIKRIYFLFDGKINSLRVYVKSNEGKAYFVVDDSITGSIDLFNF